MKYRIGKYNPETRTVQVTFTHDGIKHCRPVNVCLTTGGEYDRAATIVRIKEVGRGVEAKIAGGMIG